MKKVFIKGILFCLTSVLFFLASCKIGLGEAVDTVPPQVTISLPQADSQIRDTFTMSGEWNDDLALDRIEITLKNLETRTDYGPFSATTKHEHQVTNGTWSCTIEPISNGEIQIPDGVYTASITAYDTYNKTGLVTQTFSIDNTSPILTIKTPSTTADINSGISLASFGKIFDIKGEYSDESGVDAIEVTFFDENGNQIDGASTSLKVKGTTIDESVAVWGAVDGLYEKIYGNILTAGTKSFYCSISIYDSARKVPAVDGDKGNVCDYFYLTDEITEKYFSDDAAGNFKAKEAYAILSGKTKASDLNQYYEAWYRDIEKLQKKRASFTINPANNPTFTVTGYSSFIPGSENEFAGGELLRTSDNVGVYEFKDKNKLNLTVSPGLDNYGIKKDSVKLHLIECDVHGVPILNNGNKNDVEILGIDVRTMGDSVTIEASINADTYAGISIGSYYIISVEGVDTKGNIISNGANVYAIKYMPSNTSAPNVKIVKLNNKTDKVNSTSISGEDNISIEGTLSYFPDKVILYAYYGNPDEEGSQIIYQTTEIDDAAYNSASPDAGFTVSAPLLKNQKINSKFTLNIPKTKIDTFLLPVNEDTFELHIVAKLVNAAVNGSTYFQVEKDTKAPEFEDVFSVSPEVIKTVDGVETQYVNGTVVLTVSVSDNLDLKPKVEYSLNDGATWNEITTTKKSVELNTTTFTDKAPKVVKFRATDKVGNVGTKNITLNVDQSTDEPVVTLTNVYNEVDSLEAIKASSPKKNIYGKDANNVLNGTITDDDGIAEYQFIFDGTPYGFSKYVNDSISCNGKTSVNVSYNVPTAEGTYDVYIYVKDSKGETSTGFSEYNPAKTIKFATIAVDEGAPNFTITTTSGALQAANTDLPVTGNWFDGTAITIERMIGIPDLEGKISSYTKEADVPAANIKDSNTWTDTIPAAIVGTDGGTRYYKATDEYGQSTIQKFIFKVDSLPPEFTVTSVNGVDVNRQGGSAAVYECYAKSSGTFVVKGNVYEPDPDSADAENEGSGLDNYIYYYIADGVTKPAPSIVNGSYVIDETTWGTAKITPSGRVDFNFAGNDKTEACASGEWTATIDISSGYVETKDYTLYIVAKDQARNISKIADSPSAKIILKPDSSAPVFNDLDTTTDGIQDMVVSNISVTTATTEDITFTVDVSDARSGVASVKLYRNGVDTGLEPEHTVGTSKYKFTVSKDVSSTSILKSGTNSFYVVATDAVGNNGQNSAVVVSVDKDAPKVSIGGVSPSVSQGGNTYFNGKINVNGVATDETGLKEIRYFFGDVTAPYTAVAGQVIDAADDGTYKSYDFEIDTRNLTDNVTTKLTVVAVDKAGNLSLISTKDLAINQTTDLPVITPKAPLNNTTYAVTDIATGVNLFTTTSSIGAELSDDDGIASVEIYVNAIKKKTINLSENPTTYSLNVSLSDLGITTVGDYRVQIKVIDSALSVSTSTKEINVGIDNGAPTLSLSTTANGEKKKDGIYFVKDGFKITSTVKDDYKLESLTWAENGGALNSLTVTKDETSQTVETTFVKPASSKKSVYKFVAKDKFGQSVSEEQTYIFDLDKPSISNITYTTDPQSGVYYYNSEKNLTISGKAAETGIADYHSGLDSVDFIVFSGHHATFTDANNAVAAGDASVTKSWQSTTGTAESWSAKLDTDTISEEGSYTVFIRAKDFAGNETISSAIKVIADSAKPELKITKINTNAADAVASYYTDSVVIEGKVIETYLKTFTVTATKDGVAVNTITKDVTPNTGVAQTTGTQDWKLTIPATDGDYAITITATDYLNQTVSSTLKTKVDLTAPTFSIISYTGSKADSTMPTSTTAVTCYGNVNDYFTVKGEAVDSASNGFTSGLEASIYYKVATSEPAKTADNSTYDISTWSTLPLKSDGKTFEIPVSFADFNENDSCTIYIAAKDKAGNVSTIAANPSGKMIVKIDGTAPTVKTPVLTIGDTTTVIKVAAQDGNSLIKSAVLKLDGSEYAPSGTGALTVSSADGSGGDAGYTIYTYTIKNDLAELNVGANTFTITVTDNAGNSKTSSSIVINNNAPSLSDVVITNADEKNKSGEFVYEKDSFTISGKVSVSGNNKLASVTWKDTYDDADVPTALNNGSYTVTTGTFGATIDPTSTSTTGLTVSYKSYENKKVTRTVTAKNVYGESSTAVVKFVTDVTAPSFVLTDSVATISGLKVSGDLTTNLGWYNSTTLPIKGSVLDNGSGIEKVDYQINATSGEFYTSKTTISSNAYYTFSGTSSAFTEGAGDSINTISFSVTDKAGNTATLSTVPNIKIDTTAPSVGDLKYKYKGDSDTKTYESAILTNKGKNIILNGTFTDEKTGYTVSGVNAVTVKLNGKEYTGVLDGDAETWSAEVVTSDLNSEGSYQAQIFVTDTAGNSDGSLNCLFKVDTVAPSVDVESPSNASALNGNNTFSGSVSELNNLKSIELFYQFNTTEIAAATLKSFANWTTTGMKKVVGTDDVQLADISNWKFNAVNVNDYLGTNTSGYLYILPVSYDEAGNESINELNIQATDYIKYEINLESDRPTIQFSNLPKHSGAGKQFLTHTTTLSGSISDDDGIKEFKIANQASIPADWSTIENVAEGAGSFTYDLGSDGEKQLWFYIKDSADGVFVTGGNVSETRNNAVYQPKLVYSSKTAGVADTGNNSTVIKFTTDSNAPVVGEIEYAYAGSSEDLTEESAFAALTTGDLAGGTERKYIMLGIESTDDGSGLNTVTAEINSDSYTLTKSETTDYWYTTAIDVSEWVSSNYTISIVVTDKAGLSQNKTKQLIVDNDAPVASLISPVDEVTGSITLMGTSIESSSTLVETKYVVGTNTINSVEKALVEARKNTTVCNLQTGSSASGWKFVLDGTDNAKLPANATELESYSSYETAVDSEIYKLPVYIYTKDSLGNDGITEASITFNPYGDRPKASLTYPLGEWGSAANVTDYSNITGSMRITGAAEDNAGIGNGKVYVQLDVNNDGKFDADDKALLAAMTEYDGKIIDDVDDITDASFTLTDYSAIGDGSDFWGIKVNGTNSWNYTINTNNELQIESTSLGDSKYKVGVRAIAIDNTGVMGKWSTGSYFMIDLNAPSIESASIWTNPEDTDEVAATYQDDMFLRGTKYLQLKIKDLQGLKNVKYTYATSLEGINTSGNSGTAELGIPETSGNYKVYTVNIPISELADSDHLNSTSLALKVTATKDSDTETTSYEKYNVYFDNTAPAIGGVTLNGIPYDTDDVSSQKIVNSNGYFTIGGQASDDGAGFERMSFYFMRPAGSTITEARLYDVMIAPEDGKTSQQQASYVALSGLTKKTITIDDVEFDMYGATQAVTISDASIIDLDSADSHIRAGGYVQIGETWHKINSKSGTTLTLVTETTATGSVSAFFPYMQSIDNTGTEKSNGAGGVSSGDDGDTMPESIIKSQTTWNYDASFFSNYIPDGPGYLVTFVYDKAGNVSAAKYKVSVENNAPRLTKLWLATDLNNSGTFADEEGTTELVEYNVLAKVGEQTNYKTMKTADYKGSRFIIKNKLAVIPEFTNGNGTIYMAYNNNPGDGTALTVGDYATQEAAEADLYNSDATKVPDLSELELARIGDTKWAYVIASADLGAASYNETTGDEDDRAMSFTFWDSTEDTISGVSSNSCYLKITDLVVNVLDKKAPNVVVKPFFWNNHEDNSLYKNSYKNGHIDLPATITEDPKVSGIISIRGSAFDDHSLSSIWVKYDGFTPDESVYDGAADSDGYYKVASYEDGIWTSYAQTSAVEGDKWNFTVTPDYLGQAGHKVSWQLDIDTSAIEDAMGDNKKVYVRALDAVATAHVSSESAKTTSTEDSVYNVPAYQMDVVPYIFEVLDKNQNSANRSRLGRYPVQAGATIYLKGFNFGSGTISVKRHKYDSVTKKASTTAESDAITATRESANLIKITAAPQYSGYINLTIGTSKVQNNLNVNEKWNIQEGYVATEEDTYGAVAAAEKGKNFWTDDVYLSVWNVGGTLTQSLLPVNGTIENFGDATGKIYNGSINFQYVTADRTNRTYGIYGSNAKMIYNGWFQNGATRLSNLNFQANTSYKLPPAEVDTCIVGDKPMYVVLDNGIDGSGTWSSGLYCAIDGWNIPQSANQVKPIEVQGNGANDNPDSSDGMDDILFQFRNPKIAGYKVSNNEYYAYVSYYDSYARCLKYSKFKFTGTGEGDKTPVVAMYGNEKTGIAVVDGYDTLQNNFSGNGWDCGEFSDIKVDGTIPVIAYYSNSSSSTTGSGIQGLRIARGLNTAPKTYRVDGTTTIADYANEWIYTDVPTPAGLSDFGRYVSMEMDNSGGLHIIAQGTSNMTDSYELWYMYLKKASDGNHYEKVVEMKVDTTSSVGRYTDIKLGKTDATGLQCYPTVTYMDEAHLTSTRAVKVAYLDNVTSASKGIWECMTDPASYAATNQKLSIVLNTYDNLATPIKNKLAVGINSDLFVIDCLRNESDAFTTY